MILKLLVVQGQPHGKQLFFGPGEYYLGRGPECHIRVNTDWVSRQHSLLHIDKETAFVRDLSRNGTLVNGKLISGDQELNDRDQIQIGSVVFEVELLKAGSFVLAPGSKTFFRDSGASDSQSEPNQGSTVPEPGFVFPAPPGEPGA